MSVLHTIRRLKGVKFVTVGNGSVLFSIRINDRMAFRTANIGKVANDIACRVSESVQSKSFVVRDLPGGL